MCSTWESIVSLTIKVMQIKTLNNLDLLTKLTRIKLKI